ncbi:MAG TPA: hypothetical protein PKN14_10290 [Bacteroidia bacterium]|nr:MAG: hypothetical protein UZ10_BCD003000030 [Bacteroidetes bacterium OLB10]HNR49623.1 hypothetical protein [Bacteroidia bacterium]HNT83131.1 hypothetical protein [Bacteroidia bacterium]
MNPIYFTVRWREKLVASCHQGALVFELTMGKYHVYFPDEQCWKNNVPAWATNQWKHFYSECSKWCAANKIPITLTPDALVYEEKRQE